MKYQTIVSATQLNRNLNASDWLILDCRGGFTYNKINYDQYIKSHIPNAHYFWIYEQTIHETNTDKTNAYSSHLKTDQILQSFNENGFNKTSQIILYDDLSGTFTDKMWLFLRSLGYENVAVLTGGYKAWQDRNSHPGGDKNQVIENPIPNVDDISKQNVTT